MPIRTVPGTDLTYYLIAFDGDGRERTDDPAGTMSERAAAALGSEPFTDVFLFSHGWQGDVPKAVDQYDNWTRTMAQAPADVERARRARPGFRALLIGLHWPSLPWGEETLPSASFAAGPGTGAPLERRIDDYAERLADTPAAREALRTIFDAAMQDVAPPTMPEHVRVAYQVLNQEAGLEAEGPAAPPGADREAFDPEAVYEAAQEDQAVNFAPGWVGGLLTPLRLLSFWKMKDRARRFGETGASELLAALQRAAGGRDVRFHLMGHSFGCIAASALVAGPGGRGRLVQPVDSLTLVQGAMSLWSYCTEIPSAPGQAGYFRGVVTDNKVRGPILTTRTPFDTAVGRFYPLGAGVRQQVSFAPGELPKYGAVGAFGLRGPGLAVEDKAMLTVDRDYGFQPRHVYNIECSEYIRQGSGADGAHGDFLHPEVAHAVWEAALASLA